MPGSRVRVPPLLSDKACEPNGLRALSFSGVSEPGWMENNKVPWAKLRMLLHLHAPGLAHHIPDLSTAGHRLAHAALIAAAHRTQLPLHGQLREQLNTQWSGLNKVLDVVRDEMINDIRQLADVTTRGLQSSTRPPRWETRA
jgi:hypothetical protein